jgi:hypothetical protein
MLFGGLIPWFLSLVAARKSIKKVKKHTRTSNSGKWLNGQHHSVASSEATT